MERLIADAAKLDSSIKANDLSFGNIVKAINVVQTEMGITGTTALEAGRTISGSVGAMKAAWTNLVTGFADGSADIGGLIDNLVTTIVGDGTENNLGVIGNVLPAIETALGGIAKLIEGAAPKIIEILPGLVTRIVPSLISAATGMVNAVIAVLPDLLNTVVDAIIDSAPALIDSAIVLVGELSSGILSQLPQIFQLGLDLIVSLATGIAENLDTLIPTIVDVIIQIVSTLTNPETLGLLLGAAIAILTALSESLLNPDTINQLLDAAIGVVNGLVSFLMQNLSPLLNAAIDIIMALVGYILDPSNLAQLVQTAIQLVATIAGALVGAAGELVAAAGTLILELIGKFKETDWSELGKNLVDGFKQGIQDAWSNLKEWFEGLFDDLIGIAKRILGISSPSKVFKKIGAWSAEGFGIGWEDEFANVAKDVENSLNFGGYDYEVVYDGDGSLGGMLSGIGGAGGVTVVQNIYSEAKTAADLMQEAIYQQERAVFLGV